MTAGTILAFAAGASAVFGAWEGLGAVEGSRVAAALGRAVEPLSRAGREGRAPTRSERRRLGLVAAAVLAGGGWLTGGPVLAVVAATAGPGLAVWGVRSRRRRYARELARGAAAAARALGDAVAAGHSVRGAVAVAAEGTSGAVAHELRAAARGLALGDGTPLVLERLRRRATDPAWDAIVAGILLQRDAGGDLAGLLRDQAASLEAADRTRRDARAATAQARFTARLVVVLPLGAAALAELASPGLARDLLAHPVAVWLVATAAVLQLTAVLAITRLAKATR